MDWDRWPKLLHGNHINAFYKQRIFLFSDIMAGDGRVWKRRLGLALLVLSFVIYSLMLVLPLLPLSAQDKLLIGSAIVVIGESSFWLSVLILGKEAAAKYRHVNWRGWRAWPAKALAVVKSSDPRRK